MRLLDIRRDEVPALAWAAVWFFCVLAAYYTLRPVRETFASGLTHEQRASLFVVTLLVMIVATPLYGLLVSSVAKRWLVPAIYGFFIANLLTFWAFIDASDMPESMAQAFFVWISVFNLYVVTLFWGTIVDLFNGDQGKRLFGYLFGAGTLGQLISSWGVQASAERLGLASLLGVSAVLLLAAVFCSWQLRRIMPAHQRADRSAPLVNKHSWSVAWQGMTAVKRSPYLLGIAAFVVLISVCATVVYFQMSELVRQQLPDPAQRLSWFAKVNATHAGITLLLQTAVVGWLLKKAGIGFTLALVPAVFCVGFATLSLTQTLLAVGVFQVALRAAAFSLGNPALEVLFTAVAPEQKYRAKAFIDTVGKRAGDVLGAQAYAALAAAGWLVSTVSLVMLPITLGLIALCLVLGSAHQRATTTATDPANGGSGT
jgi:AAA family ATP:ADP antiporter